MNISVSLIRIKCTKTQFVKLNFALLFVMYTQTITIALLRCIYNVYKRAIIIHVIGVRRNVNSYSRQCRTHCNFIVTFVWDMTYSFIAHIQCVVKEAIDICRYVLRKQLLFLLHCYVCKLRCSKLIAFTITISRFIDLYEM